jgi:hypothetical protein
VIVYVLYIFYDVRMSYLPHLSDHYESMTWNQIDASASYVYCEMYVERHIYTHALLLQEDAISMLTQLIMFVVVKHVYVLSVGACVNL